MDKVIEYLLESGLFKEVCTATFTAVFTGMVTYFITKYKCENKFSLDKMEIAYNRIYYPMYVLLRDKMYTEIEHKNIQNKFDFILKKYDKYISQSTRHAYKDYISVDSLDKKRHKECFVNFSNNIFYYNNKFRKLLGYPQAGIVITYRYIDIKIKRLAKLYLLFCFMYLLILIYAFSPQQFILYVFSFCFCLFLIYILMIVVDFVRNKLILIWYKLRDTCFIWGKTNK